MLVPSLGRRLLQPHGFVVFVSKWYNIPHPTSLEICFIMPPDAERQFADLIFHASQKYGSWDPEVAIAVGDYGRITQGKRSLVFWRKKQGIFVKDGNIYEDGLAEKYEIPTPQEHGVDSTEGISWITSENVERVEITAEISM